MSMEEEEGGSFEDVGQLIDELLEKDDGALLARLAQMRANMIEVFGRPGVVRVLCECVESAPTVDFFSKRSKREIDPLRPTVALRVDSAAGLEKHPDLRVLYSIREGEDLEVGNPNDEAQQDRIVAIKAAIVHREVCQPIMEKLNEALHAHWQKARVKISAEGKLASMILTQIFSVTISSDTGMAATRGRMCQLRLVL